MNVIERLASEVEAESSSDMEAMCRYTVAADMRSMRRLLTADEIEDLVQDVVTEEATADLEDVEDGEVTVSDLERDNIDPDEIVTVEQDGEDVEGVIVEGRFARLRVVPDHQVRTIAASISKHVEMLAHMANINEGINIKSLYHPVPDVAMPCPVCASRNVTPVWYDSGEVIACCNDCSHEFEASIDDVAHATLAERTVEDVDILPEYDVFGSVWLEDEGYGYEVYAEGELVDSGAADSYEEILDRFDDIADAYDEIAEGTEVDLANGSEEVVEDIDGDALTFESGRTASRARMARMVADKKAFLNNSRVSSFSVQAGQAFTSHLGTIIVDEVMPDGVYATIIACKPDGSVSEKVARFTAKELETTLLKGGYLI